MKTAPPILVQFLGGNSQFLTADLYTLTLIDGSVTRYSTTDVPITLYGVVFLPRGPLFEGLRYKLEVGVAADEQTIDIHAGPDHLLLGRPFLAAVAQGVLDGARLRRDRAFLTDWALPPVGAVLLFSGRVGAVDRVGRQSTQIKVKSDLVLLDVEMPRNTYQTGCVHSLFDGGCGLAKASFGRNGQVGPGVTVRFIPWGGSQVASFDQGTITLTSGPCAGLSRTIKSGDASGLTLAYALPTPPAIGDQFVAYSGCDKTMATCSGRFNNLAQFRGFPFIPVPETGY